MAIDRSSFLLITGALAAGGAGGYYAHQQGLVGNSGHTADTTSVPDRDPHTVVDKTDTVAAPGAAASVVVPVSTTVTTSATLPVCDDSQGTAAECPAMGMPTEEGGCGNFASTRCEDFKASMKPRVAEAAVQCLRDLKPTERCDKARVNLCGHLALMNACIEPDSVVVTAPPATNPASPTTVVPAEPRTGSVAATCSELVKAVGTSRLGPTLADCKQTLAGLNEIGKARMLECMKKDWSTKGLLGCEAVDSTKIVAGKGG